MLRGTRGGLASQGITFAQFAFQLVVTIAGVYIAIHLQDGADQRSRSRAAQRTLTAIEAELGADESNFDTIIAAQRAQIEYVGRVATAVRDPNIADSTLYRLLVVESTANRTFFSRGAGYATLLATGQFEHVDDQRLRLALAQIYEHDYDRLRLNGELSDGIFQDVYRRAQLNYWDYEARRRIPDSAAAAVALSNAAHRMQAFGGRYIEVMEISRERVRQTRRLVADYLARSR